MSFIKHHMNFIFRGAVFALLLFVSGVVYAQITPLEIYKLAQEGDIKALRQILPDIDAVDQNENTALCLSVYRHDYSSFHLLRTVGANSDKSCIRNLTHEELNSFNAGYKSWFYQVQRGKILPNWMKAQPTSTWLNSFKGYALEIGLIGAGVGILASKGSGGSSGGSGGGSGGGSTTEDCSGHGTLDSDNKCQCDLGYEGDTCSKETTCDSEYKTSCSSGYHQDTSDLCQSGTKKLYKCVPDACTGYSASCSAGYEQDSADTCESDHKTYYKCVPKDCTGYSESCSNGYQKDTTDTCQSGSSILYKCIVNDCTGYTESCPDGYSPDDNDKCTSGTQILFKCVASPCVGYLNACPEKAKCEGEAGICLSGNTRKYKVTSCDEENFVPSHDGTSCIISCAENNYASGNTCVACPENSKSPANSSSINDCKCLPGTGKNANYRYEIVNGVCTPVDFINVENHPGNTKTAEQIASESEFKKGHFLSQINAQYAYERGYNGLIAKNDGSVLTNEKIKVGVWDNAFDVDHPDLTANVATRSIGGTVKNYGYSTKLGPCRNGDTTNCYGLVNNTVVWYDGEGKATALTISKTQYNNLLSYDEDYDWDKEKYKYNVSPDGSGEISSYSNASTQDHGTHVSGIIAAAANSVGMQGVVPNAELYLATWTNDNVYDIDKYYAAEYFKNSGARVVNGSFGVALLDDDGKRISGIKTASEFQKLSDDDKEQYIYLGERKAYQTFAKNNIVVVRSAGNDGENGKYETGYDTAIPLIPSFSSGEYDLTNLFINVVALDKYDRLSSYSQYCGATQGFCISAPGGDINRGIGIWNAIVKGEEIGLDKTVYAEDISKIRSLINQVRYGTLSQTDAIRQIYSDWGIYSTVESNSAHNIFTETGVSYGYMQGTSMAAPVVTGSVVLLMSAYPYLTSQQIVEILFRSANKDLYGFTNDGTWTDSFGHVYNTSSIYGHGEVDLQAATEPLGDVGIPMSGDASAKRSLTNTKLALPLFLNSNVGDSLPKTIMGLDDYNRPFAQSISGLVYQAKHNSDNFKKDFRSFIQPKKISSAGVQDKLSFSFSSSQTDRNLLGMGTLDMMYHFDDANTMKFSYRSDVLAENSISEKVLANPFVDMTDSYALGHEFKFNSKLGFGFSAITGKNGFYETDDEVDEDFKKSVHAFDMSVVYKPVSSVSFKAVGGLLREKESLLGMNGSGVFETDNGSTYYTGGIIEYAPSIPFKFSAAYYYGQSKMDQSSGLVQFDRLASDSFSFEAKYQPDDKNVLGFQLISPLRICNGHAIFNLPVARDLYSDTVYYDQNKVSLKPTSRELDLGFYYLSESPLLDWRTELMMRLHPDHVAEAKPDYRALLGLSWKY